MAQARVPRYTTGFAAASVALILSTTLVAACGRDEEPRAVVTVTPTPIGDLDTGSLKVVRVAFCDLVQKQAIRRALAGPARSSTEWANGERVPGTKPGDIGHEVGCAWTGTKGRTARAWVFARPVSSSFALSLVKSAAREPRCRVVAGPRFGHPSVTQICSLSGGGVKGGVTRVRYAGLFTHTWLTCEVTGSRTKRAAVKQRAGTWCVDVATTLDAEQE